MPFQLEFQVIPNNPINVTLCQSLPVFYIRIIYFKSILKCEL